MTNLNLPENWNFEHWGNLSPEQMRKEIEKNPSFNNKEEKNSIINLNKTIVLLEDFRDKNLHQGFVCNFEYEVKHEDGQIQYLVSHWKNKRGKPITNSVQPLACLRLIYHANQVSLAINIYIFYI